MNLTTRLKSLFLWFCFALCLLAVLLFILGAILAPLSNVTEVGYSILATLFFIEMILFWNMARKPLSNTIKSLSLHISVFITIFLVVAFNVNLFHSPTGYFVSKPVLEALDSYKKKYDRFPKTLEELSVDKLKGSNYFSISKLKYESDGYRYELTVNVGGPLKRQCIYWVSNFRHPSSRRCKNLNF